MPNIPYKSEKSEGGDEDYEILSFEDFCDKSSGSKTDLLTLNDNINYRLCYEADRAAKVDGGENSQEPDRQSETSLGGAKCGSAKTKLSNSFAPFGKSNAKSGKAPLFSGVIPKTKEEGESRSKEPR